MELAGFEMFRVVTALSVGEQIDKTMPIFLSGDQKSSYESSLGFLTTTLVSSLLPALLQTLPQYHSAASPRKGLASILVT